MAIDHLSVPIRFQSRPEALAAQLRHAILTGSLKPGDRLVEQKLAAKFGVGQPTLREALKDLEFEGFVRKNTKKHTHVTQLTKQDYRQILEVRLVLEAVAVQRAARRLTSEAVDELEQRVMAMQAAASRMDLVTFHQNDLDFHRRIWELAGNPHLTLTLGRVAFGLFAFVLVERNGDDGAEFRASALQHRGILDQLKSGDPAAARSAFLDETLRFWKEYHQVELETE